MNDERKKNDSIYANVLKSSARNQVFLQYWKETVQKKIVWNRF